MADPIAFLEWFRVDHSRATRWLLGIGVVFVFVGAGLVATGILTHGAEIWHAMVFPGAILLVVGLVTAFGGLTFILARDEYLGVRPDGILVHCTRGDVLLAWDDLIAVKHDAESRALVFATANDARYDLVEQYTGVTLSELASHLDALLRKAKLGPLDSEQVAPIALGLPHRRPR